MVGEKVREAMMGKSSGAGVDHCEDIGLISETGTFGGISAVP